MPFYIVLSKDDKALWLSRTIGGGVTRVGDNPNTAELAALGATVIDLTDVKGNNSTNHDKFDQLAAVAPQLRSVLAGGIAANPRAADLGGGATQGGLGAVVALPITLLGRRSGSSPINSSGGVRPGGCSECRRRQ